LAWAYFIARRAEADSEGVFNPLDKTHLAESVRDHLLKRPVVPLPPNRFKGAGIYVIYYTGDFPAYRKIAGIAPTDEKARPIYVGKAVPKGSRKGGRLDDDPAYVLHRRLSEHADSIEQARNLNLSDFHCRYLLVDDIWIPLGESLLIETFKPVWNKLVDGFGHHDQGKARRTQKKSAWDSLHPGRSWAEKVQQPNDKSPKEIEEEVVAYLSE
jgi:hypothetical protein